MNHETHASTLTAEPCDLGAHGGRIDWPLHRALRVEAAGWGVLAAAVLTAVYFGIVTWENSFPHAIQQFVRLWYWMVPLIAGFALQMGLFAYARGATRDGGGARAGGVVASGGTSTVSMVACCAHHVTDVLPALGLAGAATVLAAYQGLFLLLGVLSNLLGLVYVLGVLRRHGLYPDRPSALSSALHWPVDRALLPAAGIAVVVFTAAAFIMA